MTPWSRHQLAFETGTRQLTIANCQAQAVVLGYVQLTDFAQRNRITT